jgi:hypothetical protein
VGEVQIDPCKIQIDNELISCSLCPIPIQEDANRMNSLSLFGTKSKPGGKNGNPKSKIRKQNKIPAGTQSLLGGSR